MRKSEIWAQKFFILAQFWLDNLFIWLDFDLIFDSIGSKFKSQNYSTRPDSTVNDSVGSWLEQFPTQPIPSYDWPSNYDLSKNQIRWPTSVGHFAQHDIAALIPLNYDLLLGNFYFFVVC